MMLRMPTTYDPAWPVLFDRLRTELQRSTGLKSIFHIGSTAVPGLAAKPIIDIQLGVASLDLFDSRVLKTAGFEFAPEIDRDDVPPGYALNPGNWQKLYARLHVDGVRIAHLHIRQNDLPNFRLALLVRDFLRAEKAAAALYATFKMRAAEASKDGSQPGGSGVYLNLKDPFVALLIMLAERWATQTRWTVPQT